MTSEPGTISAATSGKAAEDGSPGTVTSAGLQLGLAVERDAARHARRRLDATLGAESRSMRSVWSRVASGSITVVTPGALRPASSTADFTCAEATGRR